MAFAYAAAGLTLVADVRLPHLPPAPPTAADLRVYIGRRPAWASRLSSVAYSSPHTDTRGIPILRLARAAQGFCFNYADDCLFWIDVRGSAVWVTYASTLEDACTYLIGPVLSFLMRIRGDFSLHASAVASRGGAVAFAGPHGVGKSTTAAALGRLGFPVLTDDILRVTPAGDAWVAHPLGGILRLWPDGELMVFGAVDRLSPITPTWNKRALSIGVGGVPSAERPLPLAGVIFLTPDDTATAVSLAPLSQADAVVRLAANSSAAHLLDSAARAREFQQVAAIASSVPCAELTRPATIASLDKTVAVVQHWIESRAACVVAAPA